MLEFYFKLGQIFYQSQIIHYLGRTFSFLIQDNMIYFSTHRINTSCRVVFCSRYKSQWFFPFKEFLELIFSRTKKEVFRHINRHKWCTFQSETWPKVGFVKTWKWDNSLHRKQHSKTRTASKTEVCEQKLFESLALWLMISFEFI